MSISSVGGQGASSLQELLAMMQSASQSSGETDDTSASLSAKLMEEFDADGNGELSEDELAALMEKLEAMRENLAMMNQMRMDERPEGDDGGLIGSLMQALDDSGETEAADADGDGVVSPEEVLEYFGITQDDALLAATQGGGSEGAGSDAQQEQAAETSVSGAAAAGSSSSTQEADLNGDGIVTQEEWAEFYGVSVEDLAAMGLGSGQQTGSDSSMAKLLREAIQAYSQAYGQRDAQSGQDLSSLMDLGSTNVESMS